MVGHVVGDAMVDGKAEPGMPEVRMLAHSPPSSCRPDRTAV
jgi:hypothetical protein